jgi:hypothetical protein
MDRNHPLIDQIVKALGNLVNDEQAAERVLEHHFQHHLLVNVGGVQDIATFARILRLRITDQECGEVLDYIAQEQLVGLTIDHVETAINERFGEDRFIEP